ncbi:hypothetical protein KSP35_15285 [Aquihabitans sp. G128]|uniref:hypothetical protein n=1 Tax=Aquihabitans sp. G128 TaxID=2849779 RepID=UPI001C218031|nr:hypothetical protein [Aquihabitans sp. G128]QXC59735.1 hypothetical protein KSP35_15285 [Aquihabitans sp. G128]
MAKRRVTRRDVLRLGLGAAALPAAARLQGCSSHALTWRYGSGEDLVVGRGGWCWFQSPRAAIAADGRLYVGSSVGTSPATSSGAAQVSEIDLDHLRVASHRTLGRASVDDHTAPSVLAVDDGVQVGWTPHNGTDWVELGTYRGPLHRVVDPDSLVDPGVGTSYVSAHVVAGRRWVLYRGKDLFMELMSSSDGRSWVQHGVTIQKAPSSLDHRPYLLAASDGQRLHLVVSDGNPSDFPGCSVSYATIDPDLNVCDDAGRPVGQVGTAPPNPTQLTRLR